MKLVNNKIKGKFVGEDEIGKWQDGVIVDCITDPRLNSYSKVIDKLHNSNIRATQLKRNIAISIHNEIIKS